MLREIDLAEVVQGDRVLNRARILYALEDRDRLTLQRLCLFNIVRGDPEVGLRRERAHVPDVVGPEFLLQHGERLANHCFSLRAFAGSLIDGRQPCLCQRRERVPAAPCLLVDAAGALKQRASAPVVAHLQGVFSQPEQHHGGIRVVGPSRLFAERQRSFEPPPRFLEATFIFEARRRRAQTPRILQQPICMFRRPPMCDANRIRAGHERHR